MLPPDAGEHSIRAGQSRRGAQLRAAVRARYGPSAGGEICRHVRQPLHAGRGRRGAEGRAKAARSRARSGLHSEQSASGVRKIGDMRPQINKDEHRLRTRRISYLCSSVFLCGSILLAQAIRPKDVREIAKGGVNSIPKLQELLKNPDLEIRLEAVKQIVEIDTQHSLDALVLATHDNDPEMQIRATDGLVNFYLPGYVKRGLSASLQRVGTSLKGRFTDTNDQVIDAYIKVRPDIIAALGQLVRGGSRM